MNRKEFQVKVAGKVLQGHAYPVQDPMAAVVLIHGMGEYGRRYERSVIPVLLENSISVAVYDQFGHGLSQGKRGHHPGYEYLLDSIDRTIESMQQMISGKPLFLYGHSMGGNVALNYALRWPEKLTGHVVTSPFLRLAFEPPAWKLSMGKWLNKTLPSVTMANEIDPGSLSRVKEEVEAYLRDPLVHDRVSPAYSIDVMKKGEWAIENAQSLQVPLLLMHGTADRLTDWRASEEFASRAGSRVEFVAVEGGYHELHHDLEKKVVLNRIVKWIVQHAQDKLKNEQKTE
jgi:alpha-beta hydrolase superfamily lysophospholipase